jgi:hypothetical protein
MFAVTFTIWVKCKDGELEYERLEEVPFVPYPELEIEDDALGEFDVLQVRWSGSEQRFFCYSNFTFFESRSMRCMRRRLKAAGWKKVEFDEVFEVKPKEELLGEPLSRSTSRAGSRRR